MCRKHLDLLVSHQLVQKLFKTKTWVNFNTGNIILSFVLCSGLFCMIYTLGLDVLMVISIHLTRLVHMSFRLSI